MYVILITLITFIVHIPFGYLRSRTKKYSFKWFLYIHIPIPFIIFIRIATHTEYKYIPMFIAAAVAGQFCGGKIRYF